jgi:hypothetical protein
MNRPPLAPARKWQVITVATLVLVFAFWSLLAAAVSHAARGQASGPDGAAALGLGLAVIPFVFMVLAFGSQRPHAPAAVLKAMGLCLVVGVLVSAVAGDGVTGIVAGAGAGGVMALRADDFDDWKARAAAVTLATAYTFVLVHAVGAFALLPTPVFPLTAIGVADHVAERRRERQAAAT